ncbi:MAG: restriction endonuclease subunit S, partial [Aureispira sp.]
MTKLGEIPEDWEVKAIGDISSLDGGYAFKSSLMTPEPDKYQVIKMGN